MATNNAKDRAEDIISGNVKPKPIAPIAEQNQYITGTKTELKDDFNLLIDRLQKLDEKLDKLFEAK